MLLKMSMPPQGFFKMEFENNGSEKGTGTQTLLAFCVNKKGG